MKRLQLPNGNLTAFELSMSSALQLKLEAARALDRATAQLHNKRDGARGGALRGAEQSLRLKRTALGPHDALRDERSELREQLTALDLDQEALESQRDGLQQQREQAQAGLDDAAAQLSPHSARLHARVSELMLSGYVADYEDDQMNDGDERARARNVLDAVALVRCRHLPLW